MGRFWPSNERRTVVADYTAPHPQSVNIINAFFQRHLMEVHGYGGFIKFGEAAGLDSAGFAGDLGPIQAFRGAAGLIGNTNLAGKLQTGLPSPQPPGDRAPTIFDLMRDMDSRASAGLTTGGT